MFSESISTAELIKRLFEKVYLQGNDPNEDRRAVNFSVNYMANQQYQNNITLDMPSRVLWKITGKCNCNCMHCWACLGGEPQYGDLVSVAEQLVDGKVFQTSISGGEPFTNKNLFEIIKILKRRNMIVEIMTNGSLITYEIAKQFASLLNPSTDTVQVSLDGSISEIHDRQRNRSIFNNTIQGIRNLVKCGIKVRTLFVATPINQQDLYNTYCLANELGVTVFSFMPVFPFRRGERFLNQLDSLSFLQEILRCKEKEDFSKTKIRVQVDQAFQFLLSQNAEYAGFHRYRTHRALMYLPIECNSSMQIDAQGEAVPGPEWDKDKSAGNVYRTPIKEIWKAGVNWDEFRCGRNLTGTKCETCNIYNICGGGNMKLAYDKSGTINAPDGTCMVGGEE